MIITNDSLANEFVLDFFLISLLFCRIYNTTKAFTRWCQLEDMFQLIVTPQGIELVMVHIEVISQCLKKYRFEYKACYIFLLDTIQL